MRIGLQSNAAALAAVCFLFVLLHPTSCRGDPNYSLSFDGVNQCVSFPSTVLFTGDFTIEAWVYVRALNAGARVLEFGNGSGGDNVALVLAANSNGPPAVLVSTNTVGSSVSAYSPLPLNTWVHLAATLAGNTACIYTNGQLAATGGLKAPRAVTRTQNYLARRNNTSAGYANAILDEVRVWSIARSQAQIQSAMYSQVTSSPPGLAAYWTCDEGPGSIVLGDWSGGGLMGTLINNPTWVLSGVPIAPSVMTSAADQVTYNSAVISGTVNPNGLPTAAWFQWGTSLSFGNQTTAFGVGSGMSDVHVGDILSQLSSLTTYYFRLVATNSAGATYGQPSSFPTRGNPDADLAHLEFNAGGLTPAFDPAVTNYTLPALINVTNVTVIPTTADSNATVQVRVSAGNWTNVVSGAASAVPGLTAGTNFIEVRVTAQDVSVTKTYTAQLPVYLISSSVYDQAYTFTTLAGYPGVGSADGVGSGAQFSTPQGVVADSAGNIYAADSGNSTIRKVTPAGVVSTIAGVAGIKGSADGTNSAARFSAPLGLALDTSGRIYVGDSNNFTIRLMTPVGTNWVVRTIAGCAGSPGTNDGVGTNAHFAGPRALTVDNAGSLYVVDPVRCGGEEGACYSAVRRITFDGTNWTVNTVIPWMGVDRAVSIAVDGAHNLFMTDGYGAVLKFAPSGSSWIQSLVAGSNYWGWSNGIGASARFFMPHGVALDQGGNLYVADTFNCTIRKITPDGTNWVVSTLAGLAFLANGPRGSADGTGTNAMFYNPEGITVDSLGNIYVGDTLNNTIRKVTSVGVVSTIAGFTGSRGSSEGTGSEARFNNPSGVAVDSAGNVYVADDYNNTIRKITSAGVVSTLAGLAGGSGTNDGVGGYARFDNPYDVAVDSAGNLYVSDWGSHTIRKVTPPGVVSTIAGLPGAWGTNDGVGSEARFGLPQGIVVDPAGSLFVADWQTIRKLTPAGADYVVTTIAGQAKVTGTNDGVGTTAQFNSPAGIALDSAGNLYVADQANYTVRKVTPVGSNWEVSTIAGLARTKGNADGPGSGARFDFPKGVAVDSAGNVYVSEVLQHTIRKIRPVGTNWVVSTIGGLTGVSGSADGSGSAARFYEPSGMRVDAAGTLFIADLLNNTIRKGVFSQYTAASLVSCAPPPMNGQLRVTLLPPEAIGQWRFPWDLAWRNSAELVSDLVTGNYPIEFRNRPGYLPYPPTATAIVSNGFTTELTSEYYPTLNVEGTTNTGSLTVNIGPTAPGGAGWRFLGDTAWRVPGSTAGDLLPDTYAIEFEPVSGYSKPASQTVQVSAGTTITLWASYLLAQSAPPGVYLPVQVPADSISDVTNYPYGFNGQLQSDVGYGSGVVVQTNVVLTAAHLVFNDQTLSYVNQVYWWFRQEAGVFTPQPQAARGWYVLAGYAAQRTNDVLGGLGPDRSSPQSRNLDVAALYFPSPVAGGGYGGYLPSDMVPNPWLTGISQKLLVGYPVDGSSLGDASIVPGVMYQVGPQPYPLSLATDPVASQQVYLASWFLTYPGNSGGPLYVQYNGYYYPAAVYLGTLYNGIVPYASLVRGIDSNVVNLVTWAQALGDSGTNGTGGGVITITVSAGGSGSLAYLQVNLGPQEAVNAGAAWRLQGTSDWCGNSPFTVAIPQGGSATLEFKPLAGWDLPSTQTLTLTAGELRTTSASYTRTTVLLTALRVLPNGALAMTLEAAPDHVYAIDVSTNLLTPLTNWTEVLRLTNTTGQTTFTNPPPAGTPQYYRARGL